MEKQRRGFLGRVLVFLLSLLAVAGLVAMALSVANAYVNPNTFPWTTFFGLAFWVILAFNLVVFVLLLLLWSNKVWISVLALLVAAPGIAKSYSFGKAVEAEDSIRIMSYNIHIFCHVDNKTDKETFASQIVNMVREQNPDILCCQEFSSYSYKKTNQQCIRDFAENAGFPYVYYNRKTNYGGNVIFSKFPITKVSEDSGFGQENTYGVMVSVDAGEKGKFYVANMHLLSYKITDKEIEVLTNTHDRPNNLDTIGKSVLRKLSYASQRRSVELRNALDGMPPLDAPVIMCGDFNETPMSYNYREIQKEGFFDTFTKVGHGIKPTFAGNLPLLRIDYAWATKGVTPLSFKRYRYKASDHYPIILDFKIQ